MSARKIAKLLCFIFFVCFHYGMAQNEGSIWYLGVGQGLDFSQTPPSGIPIGGFSTTNRNAEGFATLTRNGKVVFVTSGNSIVYPTGLAVENGYYLYGTSERQVIIQKPGSSSQYYVFYVGILSWNRKDVMYCVVDVQSNGQIRVLEKNKLLYAGLHGYFTISAGCAGKDYWLVGEADRNATEGTDKMFSFKIDSAGISDPVVSAPIPMTESGAYRFSPDGTKLFFHFSGVSSNGTALADFDRTTGIVSNVKVMGPCCGFGEFSSNGRALYTNYPKTDSVNLVQYNVSQDTLVGSTVATIPLNGTRLQIARDEKIYIILMDKDTLSSLGVINNPNQTAANCDFKILNPFSIYSTNNQIPVLPEFSTDAFYKSPYPSADAGADKEVCIGETVFIGGTNPSIQHYQWSPNHYLTNPQAGQTNFVFNNSISETQTLQYILKGLGDECVKADTMTVVIHPRPMPLIFGSHSVCPGVKSVLYSTDYNPNYSYDWSIEGGTIASGNTSDSIQVDWGNSNTNARIGLTVNNEFNCISDPVTFPVRINVKLETQTPAGLVEVCQNLLLNNLYQIDNTNGSVYTWGILGGVIDQGQGSNKIKVNWLSSERHELWVIERSTTKDTVCYGSSDTLNIKVYKDSLQVFMNQVSIDPGDESKVTVLGLLKNLPLNFSEPVVILRRDQAETNWLMLSQLSASENQPLLFEDNNLQTDNLIYEYKFGTINGCQQEVFSSVHNTIRIEAEAMEKEGEIMVQWNPYKGWAENVLRYEIWRKIDSDTGFTFVKSTDQKNINLFDADKGFKHSIMVRAISNDDTLYSWSNTVAVEFEHPLYIPNVFTPTGDGLNETFVFRHIELYPQNELVVYNRYSEEVYRKRNYDGTWDGGSLSSGIYYYYLKIFNSEKNAAYKGWVQIMR